LTVFIKKSNPPSAGSAVVFLFCRARTI